MQPWCPQQHPRRRSPLLTSATLRLSKCVMQGGNNNTYCHDSELNWFNWDQANTHDNGYARFFRCLVNYRSVQQSGLLSETAHTATQQRSCHLHSCMTCCPQHDIGAVRMVIICRKPTVPSAPQQNGHGSIAVSTHVV